jgi:NAD(P)H dehydrogenase (quinone)
MILIIGANGITGRAIIRNLVARGVSVRGLDVPAAQDQIRELGAEPIVGDMRDVASLKAAMKGIKKVYHIPPRMQADELQLGKNSIEAAKAKGIQHFVYHSVIFSHIQEIAFHWEKMKVEVEALHSGLPFTIMQPTNYMQNVAWTWEMIEKKGELIWPYSADQPISWLDVDELGEAVANVLTQSGHAGATYQLCSTEKALTRHEMAAIISKVIGREVKAVTMPLDEYMRLPRWQGRKPDDMERLKTMFRHYDKYGFRCGNNKVLSMLLARAPTTYEDFIRRLVESLKK